MVIADSRVVVHMAASLDGFVARKDGRVDWLETSDEFPAGATLEPAAVQAFLDGIDCYLMGSRTYETALDFERRGLGWAYGDKPVLVLTSRSLPRPRPTVEFHAGDLPRFVAERVRPRFRTSWLVGGPMLATDCLRRGLADELHYSVLPVLIGEGIPFFGALGRDIPLHLAEVTPYRTGVVDLRYRIGTAG